MASSWRRRPTWEALPQSRRGFRSETARPAPVLCQNSVPRLDEEPAACETWTAMSFVLALLGALRTSLRARTDLTLENLALRQQLALLRRRSKPPPIGRPDRALMAWRLSPQATRC